jgi:hypothetical protein
MIKIFTSLCDFHTNYLLPAPFNNKTALLPVLIEEYFESNQRKYIFQKRFLSSVILLPNQGLKSFTGMEFLLKKL